MKDRKGGKSIIASLMVSNYNPLHSTSKGKVLSSNFKATITNQTANMGELPKYYSRIDNQLIKLMLTPKNIAKFYDYSFWLFISLLLSYVFTYLPTCFLIDYVQCDKKIPSMFNVHTDKKI